MIKSLRGERSDQVNVDECIEAPNHASISLYANQEDLIPYKE